MRQFVAVHAVDGGAPGVCEWPRLVRPGDLGATGMTFYDSELEALLGEPLAGLLFTCVGVPGYRSRRGAPPRAPVPIGTMRPR